MSYCHFAPGRGAKYCD